MGDDGIKDELRRTWESAAPGWATWEYVVAEALMDATDTMLEMAGVDVGMRVLDLACGAGSQTLRAAERVGPTGRVFAVDISRTMLAHVRQAAERKGLRNVDVFECAAEDVPPDAGPFDAGFSRLGLMLFPMPGRAVDAVGRVLRETGRFAALVFTTPDANHYMSEPLRILLRHAGKEPPAPGQPGIFALGGPGVLEDLLSGSGLADVETKVVTAPLVLGSAAEALEMMQQAFGAYRALIAELDSDAQAAAWSEVGECLKQFEGSGGFRTDLEFVIGSGARPG